MKINCIAIDDEPLALEKIKTYIKRIGYLNFLEGFDNALDALSYLKNHKVDLIFLDIQMEELSGIQMMEALQTKPKVVLTTAYDEYAVKAFKYAAANYLLKPIGMDELNFALGKFKGQISGKEIADTLKELL